MPQVFQDVLLMFIFYAVIGKFRKVLAEKLLVVRGFK